MAKDKRDSLINLRDRSPEDRKRIASMGGKKSAESRAKTKTLKEELTALLADGDTKSRIVLALVSKALDGNISAIKEVGILLNERAEKNEIKTNFLDYQSLEWSEKELIADMLFKSGATGLLSLDDSEKLIGDSLE